MLRGDRKRAVVFKFETVEGGTIKAGRRCAALRAVGIGQLQLVTAVPLSRLAIFLREQGAGV